MDKCVIYTDRKRLGGDKRVIKIPGALYREIEDIALQTGKTYYQIASELLTFALKRTEILEDGED